MKSKLSVFVIIYLSFIIPSKQNAMSKTVAYSNDNDGQGNYDFSFETSDGTWRKESGRLVNIGQPDEHIEVQGAYSYIDDEGKPTMVKYTADKNGFMTYDGPKQVIVMRVQSVHPVTSKRFRRPLPRGPPARASKDVKISLLSR